jgi:hypothetical protein
VLYVIRPAHSTVSAVYIASTCFGPRRSFKPISVSAVRTQAPADGLTLTKAPFDCLALKVVPLNRIFATT